MHQRKSIVIYLNGQTQYEAGNIFMIMLAQEFERQGLEIIAIDLTKSQNEIITDITQSVKKNPICFLSYNGMLSNLNSNGKSLYDIYDIPMVAWLVDHPSHHYPRLESGGKRMLVGCIDKNHAELIPHSTTRSLTGFFFPHFACCDVNKQLNTERPRNSNVIMPASFGVPANIMENQLKSKEKLCIELFYFLTEYSMIDASSDTYLLAIKWLDDKNISLSNHDLAAFFTNTVKPIDTYIRAKRREDLLQSFKDVGISVDIYGNAQDGHPALNGHNYHGSIGFDNLQQIIINSGVVLDSGGNYCNGTHERVLTTIAQGTLIVTPKNILWAEVFDGMNDVLMYSPESLNSTAEYVHDRIKHNDLHITGAAKEVVSKQFSVSNTVEKILNLDALGLMH